MKKNRLYFLLFIFMMIMVGCGTNKFDDNENEGKINYIEKEKILHELSQSKMPDGGYRFANQEFESSYSIYSSYYINAAKAESGIDDIHLSDHTKNKIIGRFLTSDNLNLIDVYCALSSLEDQHIFTSIKDSIREYLNTLYIKDGGYYTLDANKNESNLDMEIFANYYVYEVARMSGLLEEIKISDKWLRSTVKKVFVEEKLSKDKISLYKKLIYLADKYDIEISDDVRANIANMCEDSFISLDNLSNDINQYGIEYIMDSLEVDDYISGIKEKSKKKEFLLDCIFDKDSINEELFGYNVYKLYSAVHSLKLLGYNFNEDKRISKTFDSIEKFSISQDEYISPGYTESNLFDTYYAYSLLSKIDSFDKNKLIKYCKNIKESIVKSDNVVELELYLKLLDLSDSFNLIHNDLPTIENKLDTKWNDLINDKDNFTENLGEINSLIDCRQMLNLDYSINEKLYEELSQEFIQDNGKEHIYNYIELIKFVDKIGKSDNAYINSLCKNLEDKLYSLKNEDARNKLILLSKSYSLFNKRNYKISAKLSDYADDILIDSKSDSALYYGGDSDEDIINFCNTYYAVELTQLLSK